MSNVEKEYNEIIEQREKLIKEIVSLEENEMVEKYCKLKKQNENLYRKQLTLYKQIKNKEYDSCEHILVCSKIEYDTYEGRTYRSCGCIKCGLDNSVLDYERKWLPTQKEIMYDYLLDKPLKGKDAKVACDLSLAQAIYSRIHEIHPDINDDTAIKYFRVALADIRNIKVNDARKTSRVKRLSLDPNFKRWNSRDVRI